MRSTSPMCRRSFGRCSTRPDGKSSSMTGHGRILSRFHSTRPPQRTVFLLAGEAIWRDVTGRGFELKLKRDLGALLSWRIEAIEAETFSCVLLSVMEAIVQVAGPKGVMVLDLARIFDEATARTEARRMPT